MLNPNGTVNSEFFVNYELNVDAEIEQQEWSDFLDTLNDNNDYDSNEDKNDIQIFNDKVHDNDNNDSSIINCMLNPDGTVNSEFFVNYELNVDAEIEQQEWSDFLDTLNENDDVESIQMSDEQHEELADARDDRERFLRAWEDKHEYHDDNNNHDDHDYYGYETDI